MLIAVILIKQLESFYRNYIFNLNLTGKIKKNMETVLKPSNYQLFSLLTSNHLCASECIKQSWLNGCTCRRCVCITQGKRIRRSRKGASHSSFDTSHSRWCRLVEDTRRIYRRNWRCRHGGECNKNPWFFILALLKNPARRFTYVEIKYFSM